MLPKWMHKLAIWLVVIGALSYGLLDKLGFNLFGYLGAWSNYLTWAVGLSGAYGLWLLITKKSLS